MAQPTLAEQFRNLSAELTKEPVDSLLSNPNWGTVNFLKAKPGLDFMHSIAEQFKTLPIDILPDTDLTQLRDALTPFVALMDRIRKFTIEAPNAITQRDDILSQITANAQNLYTHAQQRMPFLALQRGDVRQSEERLSAAVSRAEQIAINAEKKAALKEQEADQIISAMREASATVGVAHFTEDFHKSATAYDAQSRHWLWITAAFGALTIGAALLFPAFFPLGAGIDLHNIQIFASKLVVLGVLFTATVWCGRMYKAAKHQGTINRHRSDALKTFQAFVKATNDAVTRDAVLMETTRSIFALTSTGYLDGADAPSGDGALKILEVVKSAASVAGK